MNYISVADINKLSESELLLVLTDNVYCIKSIKNPSESLQRYAAKNMKFYDKIDDRIVEKYIKIESIREVYYKMKRVRGIIK